MSSTAQQQAGWDQDMMAAYDGQELSLSTSLSIDGNNIIHIACLSPRHNAKQIDRYLSNPERIDIDSPGKNGYTPLMMACRAGKEHVYRVILKHSPNLRIRGADGNSVIHVACMGGSVGIVDDLLERFPDYTDIDLRGEDGLTPVMIAAIHNKPKVAYHLIKKGCSLYKRDKLKRNLLHCACIGGHIKLVEDCIKSKRYDPRSSRTWHPVLIAALCGHTKLFDTLHEHAFDITWTDKSRNTVLHIAVHEERLDFIKHLRAMDLLTVCGRGKKNNFDVTPYNLAVRLGFTDIAKIIQNPESKNMK